MRTQDRPLLRKSIDYFKTYKLRKYYNKSNVRADNDTTQLIYMADGKILHGGLSDRLCGILSMYAYAKKYGIGFRILYITPYNLSDILMPNEYDWQIKPNAISYNIKDARPVYLSVYSSHNDRVVKYIDSRLNRLHVKQIHAYTNARYFQKEDVPQLFKELFKPCRLLQEALELHLNNLNHDYVSLTFRFQQLLGDFKEGDFTTLEDEETKEALIQKCLDAVRFLHERVECKKILVTSDSKTFLERASHLNYVYVVMGNIRHIDFTGGEKVDISVDMKSFIDMLLIANAKAVHLCNIKPLYRSGFPETSSYIYNRPYFEIVEKGETFEIKG